MGLLANVALIALVAWLLLSQPGGTCADCGKRIRRGPIAVWAKGHQRVHIRCLNKRQHVQ